MGVGICIVGVGLLVGLTYKNLNAELAYLVVGGVLFLIGQGVQRKK